MRSHSIDLAMVTHAWDISDESVQGILATQKAAGVNRIIIPVNESSERHPPPKRSFPHNPWREAYISEDGKFHLDIDGQEFADLRLRPARISGGWTLRTKAFKWTRDNFLREFDQLADIITPARKLGIEVYASLNCLNIQYLARNEPATAVVALDDSRSADWLCPNNPEVQSFLIRLCQVIVSRYELDGIVLDRIRYPWPHTTLFNPRSAVACFCNHCRQRASDEGIDLNEVKQVLDLYASCVTRLDRNFKSFTTLPHSQILDLAVDNASEIFKFLEFRSNSIARIVARLYELIKRTRSNVEVALNLLSPRSAWVVGQSYAKLRNHCDWIKPRIDHLFWERYTQQLLDEIVSVIKSRSFFARVPREEVFDLWCVMNGFRGDVQYFTLDDSVVYSEAKKVLSLVEGKPVHPEIELWGDPERAIRVVQHVIEAGVRGIVGWCYGWMPLSTLSALQRTLSR